MNRRILMVDDDERVLSAYQRSLRLQFDLDVALGGESALAALQDKGPYAVIVADMQMPGMNGIALLKRVMEVEPDTVRFMLTGNADQATAVEAVNEGHIFRFLSKPCAVGDLSKALEAGIGQYRLQTAERELLEKTLSGSVELLMQLLGTADPASFGRAQEVAEFATIVGKMLEVPDIWSLRVAALLAQIGRITMPRDLLSRADRGEALTEAERSVLDRLPEVGAQLLAHIPRLEGVTEAVRWQARGFDGSGVPGQGASGAEIPLSARILHCVQAYVEAEGREGGPARAVAALGQHRTRFDPVVFRALQQLVLPPEEGGPPPEPERVSLSELEVGMVLAEDAQTRDGMLLFASGSRLGATHLEKFRNFARLSGVREPLLVFRPAPAGS